MQSTCISNQLVRNADVRYRPVKDLSVAGVESLKIVDSVTTVDAVEAVGEGGLQSHIWQPDSCTAYPVWLQSASHGPGAQGAETSTWILHTACIGYQSKRWNVTRFRGLMEIPAFKSHKRNHALILGEICEKARFQSFCTGETWHSWEVQLKNTGVRINCKIH